MEIRNDIGNDYIVTDNAFMAGTYFHAIAFDELFGQIADHLVKNHKNQTLHAYLPGRYLNNNLLMMTSTPDADISYESDPEKYMDIMCDFSDKKLNRLALIKDNIYINKKVNEDDDSLLFEECIEYLKNDNDDTNEEEDNNIPKIQIPSDQLGVNLKRSDDDKNPENPCIASFELKTFKHIEIVCVNPLKLPNVLGSKCKKINLY